MKFVALILVAMSAMVTLPSMAAPDAGSQEAVKPVENSKGAKVPARRTDTPSGLPVPRYVSLKSKTTYCRSGPSFSHPVRLTFMRQGLPVMVVAETVDHWRKIRDVEDDECWIHKTKLTGTKTAIVITDGLSLRVRPDDAAPERAKLGSGIIAKVETERDGWLRVTASGIKGWAQKSGFWGLDEASLYAAPHN